MIAWETGTIGDPATAMGGTGHDVGGAGIR